VVSRISLEIPMKPWVLLIKWIDLNPGIAVDYRRTIGHATAISVVGAVRCKRQGDLCGRPVAYEQQTDEPEK
jgi:hypothetical protein